MLLSTLLFAAPILALPASTATKGPTSANLTIYTGSTNNGNGPNCGYAVGHSVWNAGACYNIQSQGLGVPLSNTTSTCSFTLYSGVTDCNATAASGVYVTNLPKGNGEQCIITGVQDGGNHYHGSGIWKC